MIILSIFNCMRRRGVGETGRFQVFNDIKYQKVIEINKLFVPPSPRRPVTPINKKLIRQSEMK